MPLAKGESWALVQHPPVAHTPASISPHFPIIFILHEFLTNSTPKSGHYS